VQSSTVRQYASGSVLGHPDGMADSQQFMPGICFVQFGHFPLTKPVFGDRHWAVQQSGYWPSGYRVVPEGQELPAAA
jgi:hypothetical protein